MVEVLTTLVDGDIVAYRAACQKVECVHSDEYPMGKRPATDKQCLVYLDSLMREILAECSFYNESKKFEVFITGKGNFRYDIAKTAVYKGNRKDKPKPLGLKACRERLVKIWGAECSEGEEADDLIAIAAAKSGYRAVVASIDKDMLQIKGMHYNTRKRKFTHMDGFDGLHFFYKQILMGDSADNIIGLKGIGPVKAEDRLQGCRTEGDLWEAVVREYEGNEERVLENARLLWLRRYEGEIWEPPHRRKLKAE